MTMLPQSNNIAATTRRMCGETNGTAIMATPKRTPSHKMSDPRLSTAQAGIKRLLRIRPHSSHCRNVTLSQSVANPARALGNLFASVTRLSRYQLALGSSPDAFHHPPITRRL